jgi:thiol:disulfide interchange protein DsbC
MRARLLPFVLSVCLIAPAALAEAEKALSKADLAALFPGIEEADVKDSPLDGVYEVAVGAQVAYVSKDGRYLLRGDLIDLEDNANLTEQRRNSARADILDSVDRDEMIIFAPEDPKHVITVFTDIDCGYCRRFHREMEQLNALGIEVRYLFYPRSGPGTESWKKANSVWCAPDRQEAMTAAKNGADMPPRNCGVTPVQAQYDLGGMVGLRGTPAVFAENGEMLGGYLPAAALSARLAKIAGEETAAKARAN